MVDMTYIQNAYKMPWLKQGTEVEYMGKRGKITGSQGGYILVTYENSEDAALNPLNNVAYFVDGKQVADCRQQP